MVLLIRRVQGSTGSHIRSWTPILSIQDRIANLKASREKLLDFIYKQRKDDTLNSLKKIVPSTVSGISAVENAETMEIISDTLGITEILTRHWQTVFKEKGSPGRAWN